MGYGTEPKKKKSQNKKGKWLVNTLKNVHPPWLWGNAK